MKVNRDQLLSVFKLDAAPPCSEATRLAEAYIVSCAEALESFGEEEPADRLSLITAAYNALVEHGELCDECIDAASKPPRPPSINESSPEYEAGLEAGFQAGLTIEPRRPG